MMKVCIIGCGWLGYPLALDLLAKGHTIYGTTTRAEKMEQLNRSGIKAILYNGNELSDLKDALQVSDIVIITIPPQKDNTVDILEKILPEIKTESQIIYTSSIGIYEESKGEVDENSKVKEDHPVYLWETILKSYSKSNSVILRLGGLIGDKRHPVHYLSGKSNLDKSMNPVNLIQRQDIINAIIILIKEGVKNQVFNLVSPEHPTRKEYYDFMANLLGIQKPEFVEDTSSGKLVLGQKISEMTEFRYEKSIYQILA